MGHHHRAGGAEEPHGEDGADGHPDRRLRGERQNRENGNDHQRAGDGDPFSGVQHAIQRPEGEDVDVFGYHFENQMLAVNVFHMRGGKILDRREFFWDELPEREPGQAFNSGEFFSALLKQIYIDQLYVPHQVLTPVDLEKTFSLTGGNIFQGAMPLNQLFAFRPVPGFAGYRTPIRGLYLCGAAAHPGGGVMGAAGANAAREILKHR